MNIEKLIVPAAAIVGLAGCVSYAAGFFHYAGVEWMTFLSVSDYLSMVWPVIGVQLIALVGGIWAWIYDLPWEKEKRNESVQTSTSAETAAFASEATKKRRSSFFGVIALVLAIAWVLGRSIVPSQYAMAVVLGAAVLCILMPWAAIRANHEHSATSALAALVFGFLALCYSFGQANGARPFTASQNDVLFFADGSDRCVSIITLTARGALFTSNSHGSEFIQWPQLVRLRLDGGCNDMPS